MYLVVLFECNLICLPGRTAGSDGIILPFKVQRATFFVYLWVINCGRTMTLPTRYEQIKGYRPAHRVGDQRRKYRPKDKNTFRKEQEGDSG